MIVCVCYLTIEKNLWPWGHSYGQSDFQIAFSHPLTEKNGSGYHAWYFSFLPLPSKLKQIMLTNFNDFFLKCLHLNFYFHSSLHGGYAVLYVVFQSLFVSRTGPVLFRALFINDSVSFLAAVNAHNHTVIHSAASLWIPLHAVSIDSTLPCCRIVGVREHDLEAPPTTPPASSLH